MLRKQILKLLVNKCNPISTSQLSGSEAVKLTNKNPNRMDIWLRAREYQHQMYMSPRVENISICCNHHANEPITLHMLKNISTPLDCAKHMSEYLVKQSVVALVDDTPWDMNRPLTSDCSLTFVNFKDGYTNPIIANQAFWNSCSFLLGNVLESAFYPEHNVRVMEFYTVSPESGGFVCDFRYRPKVDGNLFGGKIWVPLGSELEALSVLGQRIAYQDYPFELIDVQLEGQLFQELFANDPLRFELLKINQSKSINTEPNGISKFSIYRMNDFVEVFPKGPLITCTTFIGKFSVSSITYLGRLRGGSQNELVYRAQGIALPTAFLAHFTTFNRLCRWSKLPNPLVPIKPDYIL